LSLFEQFMIMINNNTTAKAANITSILFMYII
jgi:hypothetical protein